MALLLLGLASFVSWFLSMLTGAGSPLVLIPLVSLLCGAGAVAPIITLGMLLGNSQRMVIFWQQINWPLTRWYLPGAIAGAVLGAYGLSLVRIDGLQWLIALILLVMGLGYWRNELTEQPQVKVWYFLPLAFVNAVGSALIGSTGPLLNPLYLSCGLVKEELIATKAFHNATLHLVKLLAYLYFGSLATAHLSYGLVIGAAALPGNWLGQVVLARMSPGQFRKAVYAFVALSGVCLLGRQVALVL